LQARSKGDTTAPAISDAQTLHDASQFFDASARSSTSADLNLSEAPATDVVRNTDALSQSSAPFTSLKVATEPVSPRRFDISQMQPQMILTPTDLSGLRERNPRIQLTPEQWRLFTQADGKTSLQMACQLLVMPREQVCQAAGELFELGLVTITLPSYGAINDRSSIPLDLMNADLGHSHTAQVYDKSSNPFSPAPVETHSQWGNGGNGATFILGGGWVVSSSPSHSLQSSDQYSSSNNLYAQAGRAR
jgi:hypothetical protein